MNIPSLQTWVNGKIREAAAALALGLSDAAAALTAGLAVKQDVAQRGVSSGYASLDGSGKVPLSELPTTSFASPGQGLLPPEDGAEGPMGPPGAPGATGAAGVQGATGPQGIQGDDGPEGLPGIPGSSGATGSTGSQGVPGIPGLQGEDGADGAQGPPGIQGVTGATGSTGSTGAQGNAGAAIFMASEQGPDGEQGNPGAQGNPGVTGAQGPLGPAVFLLNETTDGDQGPPGPQGAQGPQGQGLTIYMPGEDGEQGPQGAPGTPGSPGSDYMGFFHDGSLYTSRRVLSCLTDVGLASFGALTANRFYIVAGEAPDDIPSPLLSQIGVEITTAIAASTLYLHVYSNKNGYPDKYLGTYSAVSTATGFLEGNIKIRMTAGQKFFVCIVDDTGLVVVRGVSVNAQPAMYGRDAAGSTAHISYLYVDGVAAVAPSILGAPTGQVTGAAIPAIHAIWST